MKEFEGQQLSQLEHVLLRPAVYISSIITENRSEWIACNDPSEGDYFIRKSIPYNSGLFNIIREIGSNVVDNKWRSEKVGKKMTNVSISLNMDTGEISFKNNGYPIPVKKKEYSHKNDDGEVISKTMYPAELFFGKMLAGTNFEDGKGRKTSGQNGMGAFLVCAFSSEFKVDQADGKRKFYQRYTDNANSRSIPKIVPCPHEYTCITFTPDYKRFNYPSEETNGMDETLVNLIRYYAYEMAAMMKTVPIDFTITQNGNTITNTVRIKSFLSYAKMHYPESKNLIEFSSKNGDSVVLMERDVDLTNDTLEGETVEHRSYVNGILTKGGGLHLDTWRDNIVPKIRDAYNSRKLSKDAVKTKASVRALYPYFMIFIRCELIDPAFDIQTKSILKSPKPEITGKEVTDKEVKEIMKWEFVQHLEEKLLAKKSRTQSKSETGKITGFGMKLKEAGWAEHKDLKKRMQTIIYITEGISAKATSIAGTQNMENGHDIAGHYAIRGKFPNAERVSSLKLRENEEVKHLIKIIGLRFGVDYTLDENYHTLRYGRVCFFTDADDDGYHIRGLLLEFFWKLFPSLVKRNFFSTGQKLPNGKWSSNLCAFSTAVVSVKIKGKRDPLLFYTNPEFKQWFSDPANKAKVVKDGINYYKGLGSIKPHEVSRFYAEPKVINFYTTEDDREHMKLAFGESAGPRKRWLLENLTPCIENGKILENPGDNSAIEDIQYTGPMNLERFINTHLKIYHLMSLTRALPNIYDGFKESQRKIYYGVRQANHSKQVNVDMLVGEVLRNSGYHHDKKSLEDSITKMGQGFVGTNNIPLFENGGNFGSRAGGLTEKNRDWAASRYIDSKLESIHSFIFREEDEPLYKQNYDNGKPVEFEYYVPILPFILINGADGIATGNNTKIPNYNPLDVSKAVKKWIKGGESGLKKSPITQRLTPWYRGYTGDITLDEDGNGWTSRGIIEKGMGKSEDDKKGYYHIRELPVGLWNITYQQELEAMVTPPKNKTKYLLEVNNRCNANTVHFRIKPVREFIPCNSKKSINLERHNSLKNMVAIDENGYPHRFNSAEDIVNIFCQKRLTLYQRRKEHDIRAAEMDIRKTRNKCSFVNAVVTKKLALYQEDDSLESSMEKMGLEKLVSKDESEPSYGYLLSMPARSFTKKRVEDLREQTKKAEGNLETIKRITPEQRWVSELGEFEKAYAKFLKTRIEEPPSSKKKK